MRLTVAVALLLAGCFGSAEEPDVCEWEERRIVPTDLEGCWIARPTDGSEGQIRIKLLGDSSCAGVTCAVLEPGTSYTELVQGGSDATVSLKPVDCSAQCE